MKQKYQVVVVDDYRISRTFFEMMVQNDVRYALAGSFSNASDAVAFCLNHPVDPRAHHNVQNHEIDRMIQAERNGVTRVGKRSRKRIANIILNHHFKKRAGDTVIVDYNDLIFLLHQIYLINNTVPSLLYTIHPRLTSSLRTFF